MAVEHPWSAQPVVLLGLADGAVATSTTLRRRWQIRRRGPATTSSIPRPALPSDTDLTLTSVVAAEAWVAEVLAKAVLLAGSDHPFDIIGGTGAQALAVDRMARISASPGCGEYHGAGSACRLRQS